MLNSNIENISTEAFYVNDIMHSQRTDIFTFLYVFFLSVHAKDTV